MGEKFRRVPPTYWLMAITLLGMGLRLYRLGAQSLWMDEAFSALLARRDPWAVVSGTAQDTMPPLYYLLLHFSLNLGKGDLFIRLPSALWGIMGIVLAYLTAKELFDVNTGLGGALLLSLNPYHLFYSQEARMYAQLSALWVLTAFFFSKAWRKGKVMYWFGFALAGVLSLYTHNIAFLLLGILAAFAVAYRRNFGIRWKGLLLSYSGIALGYLPWVISLLGQVSRVRGGFWVHSPSLLVPFTTLVSFTVGYALPSWLVPLALLVALYAVFCATFACLRREEKGDSLTFTLLLLYLPILILFLISLFRPMFLARVLIGSCVFMLILIARGSRFLPRLLAGALWMGILSLGMVSIYNYYFNPAFARPPVREVAYHLKNCFQPGGVVIHTSDSSFVGFLHYAPELDNRFPTGDPDYESTSTRGRSGRIAGVKPEPLPAILAGEEKIWLVMLPDHNLEFQFSIHRQLSTKCNKLVEEADIRGIKVYLCTMPVDREMGGEERR